MKATVLAIALQSLVPAAPQQQAVPPAFELVLRYEGYREKAYWDVNAYRCGYGTLCPEGRTDEVNARATAWSTYWHWLQYAKERWPHLGNVQHEALAAFLYNVGKVGPRLRKALDEGDVQRAAQIMQLYVHVGGKRLKGLVRRRKEEAKLFKTMEELVNVRLTPRKIKLTGQFGEFEAKRDDYLATPVGGRIAAFFRDLLRKHDLHGERRIELLRELGHVGLLNDYKPPKGVHYDAEQRILEVAIDDKRAAIVKLGESFVHSLKIAFYEQDS